ncbi:hypothetical protein ACB098_11G169700 [Castanea mollissima]
MSLNTIIGKYVAHNYFPPPSKEPIFQNLHASYLFLIECMPYFVSSPFSSSTGGLCLSTGSFNLPNEPAGTSLRFSQLHISIMNPSGSLKKSLSIFVRFSTSSTVLFLYFMLKSFNFCSIYSMFSH